MTSSTISLKIKNSLEILTEMHGVSEADLCRETKISQPTLWRLLNGSTDPRASTLNAIAQYFNVSVDQILGNQPITKTEKLSLRKSAATTYLPIFSLIQSDKLIKMMGKTSSSNWDKWIDVEQSINNSCFAVEVIGDSMWPDFTEGTLIIADPTVPPKNRAYVLCKIYESNDIIFRQYVEDGGEKLLKPINFAYNTVQMKEKDSIIGVIIQSRNKYLV